MNKTTQKKWLREVSKLETSETPVFLVDLAIIRSKIAEFKKSMPRVKLMYAIKALTDNVVISEVADLVDGFDIASFGEYKTLCAASDKAKNPSRIVYSNPIKIPHHIEKAYKAGIRKFAFDSSAELEKIAKYAPGSEVYLRIKVSDRGSSFPLSKKFGADISHAVAFFGTAQDLGLVPTGLTFHVGSQSENLIAWEHAIEKCGESIKLLAKAGFEVTTLNLGGGFPARYTEEVLTIRKIGQTIQKSLDEHVPSSIEVLAEPGRFMTAESSVIISTVIAREHRSGQEWLYLDMGVFQGLMECLEMEEWTYPVFSAKTHKSTGLPGSFTLTGPTCDAYDTIGLDIPLPSGTGVGDRIVIGSAGAYSVVYGSEFNGFEMPKKVYINKQK